MTTHNGPGQLGAAVKDFQDNNNYAAAEDAASNINNEDDQCFVRPSDVAPLPASADMLQICKYYQDLQEEYGGVYKALAAAKTKIAILYALLLAKARCNFDKGLSLRTIANSNKIRSEGGQYGVCVWPWPHDGIFPVSPLALAMDPGSPEHWEDANKMALGAMAELYAFLSLEMRPLMEKEPSFAQLFIDGINLAWRPYMSHLRDAMPTIVPALTVDQKLSLLKRDIKSKHYNCVPPVFYTNPEIQDPSTLLMSEPIVKVIIIKLFSKSGLRFCCVPRPRSNTNGHKWGVKTISTPMIASGATDVRYLLTTDNEYSTPSSPSGINYTSDRDYLLGKLTTLNPKWVQKVQEFYNFEIFGIPPSSDGPANAAPAAKPNAAQQQQDAELQPTTSLSEQIWGNHECCSQSHRLHWDQAKPYIGQALPEPWLGLLRA
ncbi:hypothetical protein CONPUDRAFT_152028 [Coniophora puteana RWD-64-598 SS2]|uniref:Uncharacterized protein n=1 Tax=Coniophora puteana (strain RWD-64-598) TaxID=741705 RepID=A0A5M3MW70_CONPW|nr:uncharacterized protein CONPUDRAFT_152028 [Coniophora puteana RWD-64-598 SS2]EIW82984.1 hypothetical protein CONPUDRAFT_152028 [Coniophora puteana RWD-64-598 SS2]